MLQAGDDGDDLNQLAAVGDCGKEGAAWGRVDAVWETDNGGEGGEEEEEEPKTA